MSGFDDDNNHDHGDQGDELKEVTNTDSDAPAGPPRNEEAAKLAREKGWVEPSSYDYTAGVNVTAVEGVGLVSTADGNWAHNAEKYEWNETYGDIGPENKALEDQLFRSDTINRQGIKFDQ